MLSDIVTKGMDTYLSFETQLLLFEFDVSFFIRSTFSTVHFCMRDLLGMLLRFLI